MCLKIPRSTLTQPSPSQRRERACGAFTALEEELLALGVSETEGLLDRADALVWALTALMTGPRGEGPRIRLLGPW